MEELIQKINEIVTEKINAEMGESAFCLLTKRHATGAMHNYFLRHGDANVMLNAIIAESARIIAQMCKDEISLNRMLAAFSGGIHMAAKQLYREQHNIPGVPARPVPDPEMELADRIARSQREERADDPKDQPGENN